MIFVTQTTLTLDIGFGDFIWPKAEYSAIIDILPGYLGNTLLD